MRLYHASNLEVKCPKIINRIVTLDFGVGFYTTSNREQAEEFAAKVFERRRKEGAPVVNVYDFDERIGGLNMLVFDSPSDEWLDFVVHNRRFGRQESYDLIIGPVANDDVFSVIMLYERNLLTKDEAIKKFKVKTLYNQYLFCSENALTTLSFVESYILEVS